MFSLQGFRENLKQQYQFSQSEVEKIVITKLIVEHGVDVCYPIPDLLNRPWISSSYAFSL